MNNNFSVIAIQRFFFLPKFIGLYHLIWQEGLLIDFLQKKTTDLWIKKFLIFSAYLFNERFVFDKLTRFFLDFFIWPLHHFNVFEMSNVANLFFFNIFFFIVLFLSFALLIFFV